MKKIMRLIAAIGAVCCILQAQGCQNDAEGVQNHTQSDQNYTQIVCNDSITLRIRAIDKKTGKTILHPRFSVEYMDSLGDRKMLDMASRGGVNNDDISRYWIYEDETGEYGVWKIGLPSEGEYDLNITIGCWNIYSDQFGNLRDMPNYRWKGGNAKVNTRDLRGNAEYTLEDVVLERTTKRDLESEDMKGVIKFFKEQLDLW